MLFLVHNILVEGDDDDDVDFYIKFLHRKHSTFFLLLLLLLLLDQNRNTRSRERSFQKKSLLDFQLQTYPNILIKASATLDTNDDLSIRMIQRNKRPYIYIYIYLN